MALKFYLLNWIYHDAWKWQESRGLLSRTQDGFKIDNAQQTYYQKGHCHLFFSDYDPFKSNTTQAYSGEQTYKFHI